MKWPADYRLWVYKFEIFLGGSWYLYKTALWRAKPKSKIFFFWPRLLNRHRLQSTLCSAFLEKLTSVLIQMFQSMLKISDIRHRKLLENAWIYKNVHLYSKKRLKLKSAEIERMSRGLNGDERHIVCGLKWGKSIKII